jgi:hypothetical protein
LSQRSTVSKINLAAQLDEVVEYGFCTTLAPCVSFEARRFAEGPEIELIGGDRLTALIGEQSASVEAPGARGSSVGGAHPTRLFRKSRLRGSVIDGAEPRIAGEPVLTAPRGRLTGPWDREKLTPAQGPPSIAGTGDLIRRDG